MQTAAPSGDIVNVNDDKDWVIVGFFTPNYRPLSERFAESLRRQGLPFHLFAVDHSRDWSRATMRKPTIVLDAMKVHPTKTLIFMDVDCIVKGPLDGLADAVGNADFSCFTTLRTKRWRRSSQRFSLSSRVMYIRPTAGAHEIMKQWERACRERPNLHGAERNLVLAFTRAYGVNFSIMPEIYAGREEGSAPANAIVTHRSAAFEHGKKRSLSNWLEGVLGPRRRAAV